MRRIRRVSIELIHRELSLSVSRPVVAATEARPGETEAQGGLEIMKSACPPPECLACDSPWFVLSAGGGEEPVLVQRALVKHGIHTQLSSTGELFVCSRSFELHTGLFNHVER